LRGPYFLTQQAAQRMISIRSQQPDYRGTIINVGSISATVASTNRGDYCISKAGIGMATQLWAVRLAEFNIDVFELRPGLIATDMTAAAKQKYDSLIAAGLLLQPRWGTPEDIGKAAAMLVRGDLPYATGSVLMLDGGLTRMRL
jgi:3-oxoacyl-[acyl-carrier protein] reductase